MTDTDTSPVLYRIVRSDLGSYHIKVIQGLLLQQEHSVHVTHCLHYVGQCFTIFANGRLLI